MLLEWNSEKLSTIHSKDTEEMYTLDSWSDVCWCPNFSLNFLKVPETQIMQWIEGHIKLLFISLRGKNLGKKNV